MTDKTNPELDVHGELTKILSIPENRLELLGFFLDDLKTLIANEKVRQDREMFRPVVVRIEYPDSLRVEVVAKEGHPGELDAVLKQRAGAEWVDVVDADEEVMASLKRLALTTTSVIEGDVFYITTNGAVESAINTVTENYLRRSEVLTTTEEAAPVAETTVRSDELH